MFGLSVASLARARSSGAVEGSAGQEDGAVGIRAATSPRGSVEKAADASVLATRSAEDLQVEAEAGLAAGARARGDVEDNSMVALGSHSAAGTGDAATVGLEVDGYGAGGESHKEPTPCCPSPKRKVSLRRSRECRWETRSVTVPSSDGMGGVASGSPARVARSESEAEATTGTEMAADMAAEMIAPTSARMVALGT